MLGSLCVAVVLAAPAIEIPHRTFRLDNGLTVVLHRDDRVPLVAVNLSFDVGSSDEPAGRTGFAHLFEHLMFMGTPRVPQGAFDRQMEAEGAWNNAWTSEDRTAYHAVGPSHTLPLLLWLEADRFRTLGPAIDQAGLDLQRDVVRNERRQTSEETPYGRAWLRLPQLLYPPDHPYHHPVIGSHADLQAASVGDVRAFFARWYVPENATLVVAGDLDPAETEARVRAYFGSIPRRAPPARARAPRPPAPAHVAEPLTLSDRVDQPRVVFAWQSPAHFAPGDAELDLVSAVLADGKASQLQQALVYQQALAQDVYAGQWSGRLGSQFVVYATARPGTTLAALEAALEGELTKLRAGVDPDAVERARGKVRVSFVRGLQSVASRAAQLGTYQSLRGDPAYVARDLARYERITAADVDAQVALLRPERRAILRVVPETR